MQKGCCRCRSEAAHRLPLLTLRRGSLWGKTWIIIPTSSPTHSAILERREYILTENLSAAIYSYQRLYNENFIDKFCFYIMIKLYLRRKYIFCILLYVVHALFIGGGRLSRGPVD